MRKTFLTLATAAVALAFTANVFAADPVQVTLHELDERIGEMTATFTVTDDSGLESTLTPETASVTLDGRRLNVTAIEKTDYGRHPASIVLLVDVSGSMYGEPIVQAQAAVRDFIAQMEPDDRIALMSFSTGVNLLQDFTSDRSLLDGAVGGLQAFGDTALFAAVDAAIDQSNRAPAEASKLIVLLSDGVATEGVQNREPSLLRAEQTGTRIITVGLGPSLDVDYLRALATRTGGRYVTAASASQLRAAYADIARSVVHQYFSTYRMQVEVPPTIDRTVDGTLRIEAQVRDATPVTELQLGPLEGAVPPPYEVRVTGLAAGGELKQAATMGVQAPEGRTLASIEFLIDDEVVASGDAGAVFEMAPEAVATGTHKFSVRTLDVQGGQGYGEISFLVPPVIAPPPAQPEPSSFSIMPIILLAIALGIGYALYRLIQKRLAMSPAYITRSLNPEPHERMQMAQSAAAETDPRPANARAAAIARSVSRYRARIVVMRESAILAGDLHTTREYELGDAPLTIGTGQHVDIQLEDDTGMISDEEARVWVQRGRITFHRLTALSAMATAGVTPGWQFFDNGDEMRLGPYRFVFQVFENEGPAQNDSETVGSMPQEHGMTLRRPEPFGWDNR